MVFLAGKRECIICVKLNHHANFGSSQGGDPYIPDARHHALKANTSYTATTEHQCVSNKCLTICLLADRLRLYFDKCKIEKYQVNIAVALSVTRFGMCNAICKD